MLELSNRKRHAWDALINNKVKSWSDERTTSFIENVINRYIKEHFKVLIREKTKPWKLVRGGNPLEIKIVFECNDSNAVSDFKRFVKSEKQNCSMNVESVPCKYGYEVTMSYALPHFNCARSHVWLGLLMYQYSKLYCETHQHTLAEDLNHPNQAIRSLGFGALNRNQRYEEPQVVEDSNDGVVWTPSPLERRSTKVVQTLRNIKELLKTHEEGNIALLKEEFVDFIAHMRILGDYLSQRTTVYPFDTDRGRLSRRGPRCPKDVVAKLIPQTDRLIAFFPIVIAEDSEDVDVFFMCQRLQLDYNHFIQLMEFILVR